KFLDEKNTNFIKSKDLNVIVKNKRFNLKNAPNLIVTKHSLADFYEEDINETEIEAILSSNNPKNIFIHKDTLKITNFGAITIFRQKDYLERIPYIDPQELKNYDEQFNYSQSCAQKSITQKSNIYSFGVLLWQISSGKTPYASIPYGIRVARIISGIREEAIHKTPQKYFELYQKCWEDDPDCSKALQILKTANINDVIENDYQMPKVVDTNFNDFDIIDEDLQINKDISSYEAEIYDLTIQGIDKELLLQRWNLYKGLNIHRNDLIPGEQVLSVDGMIRYIKKNEIIHIYTNRNRVNLANLLLSRSNVSSNKDAEEISIRLHIPLIQVEYINSKATDKFIEIIKEALNEKDQESISKALDNVFKKYGEFIAQSVDIGGALIVQPISHESLSQEDMENLKAHIYWTYDQIMTGNPNVFDQVQFNNFKMMDANNQKIISEYGLEAWMKNFYDHKEGYVISYNRFVPVYTLFDHELKQNLRKYLEKFDENPINKEFISNMNNFEKKNLNTWISRSPKIHLCDWVNNLHLRYGLTIQPCKMGRGLEVAIKFIEIPDIRQYSNSYMRLLQPSSKREAFTLANCIKLDNVDVPFLPEKLIDDSFHPIFDHKQNFEVHCFFVLEQIELAINMDKIEPSEFLIEAVDKAMRDDFPFHSLQNVFNKFGYLWPQKIILGWSASRIYGSIRKVEEDYLSLKRKDKYAIQPLIMEKLKEWRDLIGKSDECTFFMDSNGKIVKDCDIYLQLQSFEDPYTYPEEYHKLYSQLQVVKLEDLVPLYKVLPKTTQDFVENIISDNIHIIMTGVAEIKRENQTYINIQFSRSLPDDNYEMFGNLVAIDMQRIPDVMIQFNLTNRHGCRATIHKLNKRHVFV
ncbi:15574_t:CDS:2, partial [Racocetra fulgida]